MKWKIPLFKIYWDKNDIDSVSSVIQRGNYWTTGPEIEMLEKNVSEFIGKKYALSFNSGTSALHADLIASNISNCEVIVPSFTFISTANSIILSGAKPVFAEIEDESYGLDSEDVKEKITEKTKAIIPVHYGGGPCKEIKALKEIAEDHNLILIEDAAESLGATINNKKVGSFGNSSMFSFCQNKIISGGEGGIILTDSKVIYEKLKLIRSHGRKENKENYFSTTKELDYVEIGFNFRMSSITAALILSQLKKIDKIIKLRNKKAEEYKENLIEIQNVKTPVIIKNSSNVYQMYTIKFDEHKSREKVKKHLEKAKVMSKVYFEPIHLKTFYKKNFGYKKGNLPITEEISEKVLTIPLYPSLEKKDLYYITSHIKECFK
jgi:dTDP-4-amino-4,6-dideoxygalactose transaminase